MENILLEHILDNPYQPRTTDQAEHIENLARSIAADGLLQVPTARRVLTGAELAFGHSRRKAFEWLRMNWEKNGLPDRYNGYSEMPLLIEDLSDEQMYRYAVTENVQRKDLDPIETAKAMARYRDEFGKSSKEIGDLFGMNDATVRGKMALLTLPESVRNALSSGKISEGATRLLNSLNKVLPEAVDEALNDIIADGDDEDPASPADIVTGALRGNKKVVEMRPYNTPWKSEKKFPNKHLPALTVNVAAKAAGLQLTYHDKGVMENLIGALNSKQDLTAEYMGAEVNGLVSHLINPPSCSACSLSMAVDGNHYCGLRLCWERKGWAWTEAKIQKASKDLGIAVYTEADGQVLALSSGDREHEALFNARDENLRLIKKPNVWRNFDGVPDGIGLGLVGESAQKIIRKNEQKKAREEAARPSYGSEAYKEREKRRELAKESIHRFAWDVCAPLFAPALSMPAALMAVVMEQLLNDDLPATVEAAPAKGKALLARQQQEFGYRLLLGTLRYGEESKFWDAKTPVAAFAKWAQGSMTSWGIKTPKQLIETAADYEPVAAETEA